jgi:hypothetical protein
LIHNLAHALELRFGTGKDLDDINKAIDYFRQALKIRMPPDPRRRSSLQPMSVPKARIRKLLFWVFSHVRDHLLMGSAQIALKIS